MGHRGPAGILQFPRFVSLFDSNFSRSPFPCQFCSELRHRRKSNVLDGTDGAESFH